MSEKDPDRGYNFSGYPCRKPQSGWAQRYQMEITRLIGMGDNGKTQGTINVPSNVTGFRYVFPKTMNPTFAFHWICCGCQRRLCCVFFVFFYMEDWKRMKVTARSGMQYFHRNRHNIED